MSFTLGISGPTGAGKTTLAAMISRKGDVNVITERVPNGIFMDFSTDPAKYCYSLQKRIITERHALFMMRPDIDYTVLDRTIQEDREIFFRLHHALGFLTDTQEESLNVLATEYEVSIGSPDAHIYISASTSMLRSRMLAQRAPMVLIESILLQVNLYKRWRESLNPPVFDIDNTNLQIRQLQHIANWIHRSLPDLVNCSNSTVRSQWSEFLRESIK